MVIIDWIRKMILTHRNKQRVEDEDMNNEILEAVLEYCNGKNNDLALLINGTWGSGKTYFVKNILSNEVGEKKIIYVSLFGIDSIEELKNRICSELLTKVVFEKIKAPKILSTLYNVGMPILGDLSGHGDMVKAVLEQCKSQAAEYKDNSNLIYCFDDLERTSLDIKIILGFINLTLEEKIKTLILVNEEKVISGDNEKNTEHEHEREHNCYKEFKEKVVGNTLKYSVNLEKDFDDVVLRWNYCEPAIKYILSNKDEIIAMMAYLKCNNLRTLRFALDVFETVYKRTIRNNIFIGFSEEDKNKLLKQLILQCLGLSFYQREKRETITWDIDELEKNMTYYPLGGDSKNELRYFAMEHYYLWTAKGVYKYITELIYDEKSIANAINNNIYRIKVAREEKDDPLYLTNEFPNMSEMESRELLQAIQKNFYASKYNINQYGKILSSIYWPAKVLGEKHIVSEVLNKMISNINALKEIPHNASIIDTSFSADEAIKENVYLVKECLRAKKEEIFGCSINEMLCDETFPTNMLNNFHEVKSTFLLKKSFIGAFDQKLLQERVIALRGGSIWDFGHLLNMTYGFSNVEEFYKDDKKPLETLKMYIEEHIDKCNLDKMDIFRFGELQKIISEIVKTL